jgi:hypothetical protein
MGLLDNLEPPKRTTTCLVRTIKQSLDESDQIKLDEIIADTRWNTSAISEALASKGIVVSRASIYTHRKGKCSC